MIIPSIDIMDGQAVQLIGGEKKALEAGDTIPLAKKFRLAGEIAVIDLDAALSKGDNKKTIRKLARIADIRVGGGIRTLESAIEWLDIGARKIILGTAAQPELLKELPKERLIAALDAKEGEVVVEGWTKKTGRTITDRMRELRDFVGGFLVTFVEKEGRMGGTRMELVKELLDAAKDAKLTVAGGVTTAEEIAQLHAMGVDAQVGMAIYTGKLDFAQAIAAPLMSDREDGLWPTVIADEHNQALGLAYSDMESLKAAVDEQVGAYHSRKRGLWIKGKTSKATQELLKIDLDCDHDTLRFKVRQNGRGFCHLNQWTCFGDDDGLPALARLITQRKENAPEGSYTNRLFNDETLLAKKIEEEAFELIEAQTSEEVRWEAADVLYFTLVKMAKHGVTLADVENELRMRSKKITRRKGDAKR